VVCADERRPVRFNRLESLAENLSANGYRVLLHDRRNTGASEVAISSDPYEDAMFADDVADLLVHLDATPAIALGTAAGNRLGLSLSVRQPEKLPALILCWPVGGRRACEILAETYYGQYCQRCSYQRMISAQSRFPPT
jgi:pimeloyl-ACP methyl ester carboxylesterase